MSRPPRPPKSNRNRSPNLQPAGTPRDRDRVRFAKAGLPGRINHHDLANLGLQAIRNLQQKTSVSIERKGKTVTAEVAAQLPVLDLLAEKLGARIVCKAGASLIHDVLELLGAGDRPERVADVIRTAMTLKGELEHS